MSNIKKESFGYTKDGREAFLYTIMHEDGSMLSVTDYGGAVVSLKVPDKRGILRDVVLGFSSVSDYEKQDMYMGVLIGRCANRIEGSCYQLNNKVYHLEANEGKNHLHGVFAFRYYDVSEIEDGIALHLFSPDMEEGYPGNLVLTVYYTFTKDHVFSITYQASSDQDTILNMTNHTYYNLNGHESGSIENHSLKLYSQYYTPSKEDSIPNGEIALIENTVFDFRNEKLIGRDIHKDDIQLKYGNGYDHNFILNHPQEEVGKAAKAYSEESGIEMTVKTDLPAMQFYTGNYLHDEPKGKGGKGYNCREGFCLEAHYVPASLSYSHFKQPVLRKGEIFYHKVMYEFKIR